MCKDINTKVYSKLQRFIFISFEGSTYQPDSESSQADIENMQVIGFTKSYSRVGAFKKLLADNEYLKNTTFNEVWCMRVADGGKYDSLFYIQP